MTTTQRTDDLSITTTDHPNATRMREAFAAFSRGDLDAVRATMTEDVIWESEGRSALSGTYRGWDEVSAMFGRLLEITGGTFAMDLISVLADDQHAVAIYDTTSTVQGRTATLRTVLIDEVAADGRVRAARLLPYDADAADAHFGT